MQSRFSVPDVDTIVVYPPEHNSADVTPEPSAMSQSQLPAPNDLVEDPALDPMT